MNLYTFTIECDVWKLSSLQESAVIMMPFAILFHCVFGLWLYGNQDLFPSEWGGLKGFVENMWAPADWPVKHIISSHFISYRSLDGAQL